jgi:ribosome-associated heat shock protein Hsp15
VRDAHIVERQRIDKWLWHARVVRTRSDAAALVSGGRVRVNGRRETAPGHAVKPDDVLTIALDGGVRLLQVKSFAERRGDAPAARGLYVELAQRTSGAADA